MSKLDKDAAFIEINILFNAIENENMSNSTKLDNLRSILKRLQEDSFEAGVIRGLTGSVRALTEFANDVKLKKVEI